MKPSDRTLTAAQRRALQIAYDSPSNTVWAGYANPGHRTIAIPGSVLSALARRGLLKLGRARGGELYGEITATGAEALRREGDVLNEPSPTPTDRDVDRAVVFVESQPEVPGWSGDVAIATIPVDERLPHRSHPDRGSYPIQSVPVAELLATQHVVGRESVIYLLRHGWDEPILVSRQEGRWVIEDGHHRAYAASLLGERSILARVAPPPVSQTREGAAFRKGTRLGEAAIRWVQIEPLSKAVVHGGGYLRSDDGRFVIFARRWRAGDRSYREYRRYFTAVEYLDGATYRTGGHHRTLVESSSLEAAKRSAEDAAAA